MSGVHFIAINKFSFPNIIYIEKVIRRTRNVLVKYQYKYESKANKCYEYEYKYEYFKNILEYTSTEYFRLMYGSTIVRML